MRAESLGLLLLTAGLLYAQPLDTPETRNADIATRLLALVKDNKATIQARIQAARTLGEMGFDARAIVPELVVLLNDPKRRYPEPLEEALIRAIGRIGAPARVVIPALVSTAGVERDLDRTIAEVVKDILRAPDGPGDLPALVRNLRSPDASDRLVAAKKLAAIGPPAQAAAPALVIALDDPDVDVRRMALLALQRILPGSRPPDAAISALVKDLQDAVDSTRLRAAKALGRIGPPAAAAIPALQAVARNDPDLDVRRVAADSLFRIQGR